MGALGSTNASFAEGKRSRRRSREEDIDGSVKEPDSCSLSTESMSRPLFAIVSPSKELESQDSCVLQVSSLPKSLQERSSISSFLHLMAWSLPHLIHPTSSSSLLLYSQSFRPPPSKLIYCGKVGRFLSAQLTSRYDGLSMQAKFLSSPSAGGTKMPA